MTTATSPCAGAAAPATKTAPAAHDCCTELECFEKPRFFCGQLLTDVDLEATISYVAAKNRLHNRHLFGAGVVCGLAVRCDPCDRGSVIVEAGYALDCSGNDIVVCADTTFDVQAFIDRRRKEHQVDCGKNRTAVPGDCGHLDSEYCLVLRYEEKPGKPVNALVRDNGCRSNRCEPSRTLERFRLELIDKKTADKLNVRPSAWSQIRDCLEKERAKLTAYRQEAARATAQQQELVYARLREDLVDFAKRSPVSHCDLIEKICDVERRRATASSVPPVVTNSNAPPLGATNREGASAPANATSPTGSVTSATPAAISELTVLYSRLIADCFCNALLVPCTPCCDDSDYVLLACLQIDAKKNVVSICNTVRTQVITGPAVRYWAQPVFDGIGALVENYCCPEPRRAMPQQDDNQTFEQVTSAARVAGAYASSFVRRATAPMSSPNSVRSLTLVNRHVGDVRKELEELKINVAVATARTREEAFDFSHLRDFPLEIPPDSRVELTTTPDGTVTAIRVLGSVHP